jgi:aryl-alcohol dehydrogenase-like predicted oxidoreductase
VTTNRPKAGSQRKSASSSPTFTTNATWHTKAFDTIDRLTKIASELGTSLATLSTAWVLANPTITSAILGASRPDQLTGTLAAADLDLPDDAKVALDDLTHEYRWGDAAR